MKWHFGCGSRRIVGWTNTDREVDLGSTLPFDDGIVKVALGQHVIEHLRLESEVIPLLGELRRVVRHGGELWLSTPDLSIVCHAYVNGTLPLLLEARRRRWRNYQLNAPISHFVNEMFHQSGQHHNLFDFELLDWALRQGGWDNVERSDEQTLRRLHPEVPPRHDAEQTLVVRAW